jgi:hypothetical protein
MLGWGGVRANFCCFRTASFRPQPSGVSSSRGASELRQEVD